jgi:hypothetical protein
MNAVYEHITFEKVTNKTETENVVRRLKSSPTTNCIVIIILWRRFTVLLYI